MATRTMDVPVVRQRKDSGIWSRGALKLRGLWEQIKAVHYELSHVFERMAQFEAY